MRRTLMPLLVVALFVAACSGSEGTDDDTASETTEATETSEETDPAERRQAMLELVTGDISSEDDPNALPFGEEGAACFAERIVDDLGVERLEELGYDVSTGASPPTALFTASLTDEEKERTFNALEGCVDLHVVLSQVFEQDGGLPPTMADCVATSYLEAGLLERSLFSKGADPELDQDIEEIVSSATESCVRAEIGETGG